MVRYRTLQALGELAYEKVVSWTRCPVLTTVGSIRTAELSLNTRFAYGEKYVSGEFDRVSVGINQVPHPGIAPGLWRT
jgi:hypothetical protein